MTQRTKDILEGLFGAVIVTIGSAGLGILLFYISGLDPRNDFWGAALGNMGVIVAVVTLWVAGIAQVYDNYWWNPKKKRRAH